MFSEQEKKEIGSPNHYPSNISISFCPINTWLGLVSPDETQRASLPLLWEKVYLQGSGESSVPVYMVGPGICHCALCRLGVPERNAPNQINHHD